MWRDDDELTAPAIIISSLGGLVYGKDALSAKDAFRARMLRQALKAQLSRPRGPHPRRQAYASSVERGQPNASEVLHHRVLPVKKCNNNSGIPEGNTNALRASPNPRVRINTGIESTVASPHDRASRAASKRGWRAQGLLAGEWRDRLGRHRRAYPYRDPVRTASSGDTSMVPKPGSPSYAKAEVSFEDLIEELQERLPQASPLSELVAAHQTGSARVAAEPIGTTTENLDQEQVRRKDGTRHTGGHGGSTANVGSTGSGASTTATGGAGGAGGVGSSVVPQSRTTRGHCTQQRQLPPGCLRLRRMLGAVRAPPSQPAWLGLGGNPRHIVGPHSSLVLLQGGLGLSSDGSRLATAAGVATEEDVSPSAAMVAAAKAQERALPLLQVRAVKAADPTEA